MSELTTGTHHRALARGRGVAVRTQPSARAVCCSLAPPGFSPVPLRPVQCLSESREGRALASIDLAANTQLDARVL